LYLNFAREFSSLLYAHSGESGIPNTMSTSTLSVHEEHSKDAYHEEKVPPPFVEDVEGLDHPIVRTQTTPPDLISELDEGLIAWESQNDPENPLSVLQTILLEVG
jgi:hypothetical protein